MMFYKLLVKTKWLKVNNVSISLSHLFKIFNATLKPWSLDENITNIQDE